MKARLIFTEGDYNHALACFEVAKEWAIKTGQWNHPDLGATIFPPMFIRGQDPGKFVPMEMVGLQGWQTHVFIECQHFETMVWLSNLELPSNSKLIWDECIYIV